MQEGSVIQVAYVVRDIDAAMQRHWEVCGIGPWSVYTFEAPKVRDYIYRGRPATHSCLIAVAWTDKMQVELMQPVRGRSIYDEHLERRGEGLHHIKLYHADCARAVAEYAARGYPVIQSGRFDEDEHYYLDTEKDFGYIIELGNGGRIREAERRYPA
ncbi:MAG: VOC family protein [Rhodospirillales bacterium]|nr:VOC family protein [Rhodospirillales bacterium]